MLLLSQMILCVYIIICTKTLFFATCNTCLTFKEIPLACIILDTLPNTIIFFHQTYKLTYMKVGFFYLKLIWKVTSCLILTKSQNKNIIHGSSCIQHKIQRKLGVKIILWFCFKILFPRSRLLQFLIILHI